MGEFDDMAGRMQDELAKSSAEHRAKVEAERKAADETRMIGQTYLEQNVLPTLEEAQKAFQAKGLRVEIEKNWSKGVALQRPELRFQVHGQVPRPHENSTYELGGNHALFAHDGEKFTVRITESAYSRAGRELETDEPGVVKEAVRLAAESFFKAADPARRS